MGFNVYQHQILHVPVKGIAADVLTGIIVAGLAGIGGCLLVVFKKHVRVPCLVPNKPEYSIDTEKRSEVKGENPRTPLNYENNISLDASYPGQQANAWVLKGYHLPFLRRA